MKYFTKCTCIEDVKEEYRRLAKMLHPDNGGDAEEFKRMMQAYTSAYNRFKGVHRKQTDKTTQDEQFKWFREVTEAFVKFFKPIVKNL